MVCENIFGTVIKKIPFFSSKSPIFIAKLLQKVKSIHMNSGDILYEKGAVSKYVYFLVKGTTQTHFIFTIKSN
jgi:CRP-like cAMP-binding protein